jgi:hypothetical protein
MGQAKAKLGDKKPEVSWKVSKGLHTILQLGARGE